MCIHTAERFLIKTLNPYQHTYCITLAKIPQKARYLYFPVFSNSMNMSS